MHSSTLTTPYDSLIHRYIHKIRQSPLQEAQFGRTNAIQVSKRIANAIPSNVSPVVQLASAIEAIELEDYVTWPKDWFVIQDLPQIQPTLTEACATHDLSRFQRSRYQQLHCNPQLLQGVIHGLSRKLNLHDETTFIQELIKAGRRQSQREDETEAPDEYGVLHVALSYRHSSKYNTGGTIDFETAKEAYEILCRAVMNTGPYTVRVWIDQNLHRYPTNRPWFQRGFLPYAMFTVISVLGKHGGFTVGKSRPWIWVETGMGISTLGLHANPAYADTLRDIIVVPPEARLGIQFFRARGCLFGGSTSVLEAVRQILIAVSWWTPEMLEHRHYEYKDDFIQFSRWAKAQVVRLSRKQELDLTSDALNDTIIENLAWMKALPTLMLHRQTWRLPYLRIDMDITHVRENLSLLKVSGKCEMNDNVFEVVGTSGSVFCFTESPTTVSLNVNPAQRDPDERIRNVEGYDERKKAFEAMLNWQGGFSVWDKRFAGKGCPRYSYCGSFFLRYWGMREFIGDMGETVEVGGELFRHDGYIVYATSVERVYKLYNADVDIFLSESDALCVSKLERDVQQRFVAELWPKHVIPVIKRILRVSEDVTDISLNMRSLSTSGTDVLSLLQDHEDNECVGHDELYIRRQKLGPCKYLLALRSNRYGQMLFSFDSVLDEVELKSPLVGFKTDGDVHMTLAKIRLMMGSTEFIPYQEEGLSLGLGIVHEGRERFHMQLRLEGSEFALCSSCLSMFSPVNSRKCAVRSCLSSKRIVVTWIGKHECLNFSGNKTCDITGPVG